jgi:hypothetical protein
MITELNIIAAAKEVARRAVNKHTSVTEAARIGDDMVRCLSLWLSVRFGIDPGAAGGMAGFTWPETDALLRRIESRIGNPCNARARAMLDRMVHDMIDELGRRVP